jgi:uncharacterized membrane protein
MTKSRVEAFSDGVIAIIITIMVLGLQAPKGNSIAALIPLVPTLTGYILSFVYLGIYWSNHHHLLQAATVINGKILWANLHLLFWLSLFPFFTAWISNIHYAKLPTALYGAVLLMAALAFFILQGLIIRSQGSHSHIKQEIGKDLKGKVSLALNSISIFSAFLASWISMAIFVVVAMIWFVPDRRFERALNSTLKHESETD